MSAISLDSNSDIGDFVPAETYAGYLDLVTELVRVELELCWDTNKRKSLDAYADQFPSVLNEEDCLDQIAVGGMGPFIWLNIRC